MITIGKANIIESENELPNFSSYSTVYCDVETTSFDPKKDAFYPYLGNRMFGIAISFDNVDRAWYIPIRHSDKRWNISIEAALSWLSDVMNHCKTWINHNVKFDAHFLNIDGIDFKGTMIDTIMLAKLLDSDRYGYGLKPLAREWCSIPMEEEKKKTTYLNNSGSKDWAIVPADIMGEYACQDVIACRQLYHHCISRLPSDTNRVRNTEIEYTRVLYEMEKEGALVDNNLLAKERLLTLKKILKLETRIEEICDEEFKDSDKVIGEILCGKYDLPVVAWTDGGKSGNRKPSFDKYALAAYLIHPAVIGEPKLVDLITAIKDYRDEAHFRGLFLESYAELKDEKGILHPNFNQLVRTGRGSCSKPNLQQLNARAKALIVPKHGCFFSTDASQIEFRLIVHYLNEPRLIAQYNDDPNTDFHSWVAELCHTGRQPAKTINFAMSYGAGERKILSQLASNPDIVEEIGGIVARKIEDGTILPEMRDKVYNEMCRNHVKEIYEAYHTHIPVKSTAYRASDNCKQRGFVFNLYGRRRHLPYKAAFRAFNTIVQGCAMDYMKDRMVAVYKWLIDKPGFIIINVHDEMLIDGEPEFLESPETQKTIIDILEDPNGIPFRVPMKWDYNTSRDRWSEAKS